MVGHVCPEASKGGPLAIVLDGDRITIDRVQREVRLELTDAEIAARLARWSPPAPRYTSGALAKYASLVEPASLGAITRPRA